MEAYEQAGVVIVCDLFIEDGDGYFESAALLDKLTLAKLQAVADEVQAEVWTWAQAHIDYPHAHAHGLRRAYPQPADLSPEDQERLDTAHADYDALTEEYEGVEELPDEVDVKFGELEAEIERLTERRQNVHAVSVRHLVRFILWFPAVKSNVRQHNPPPSANTVITFSGADLMYCSAKTVCYSFRTPSSAPDMLTVF